MQFIERRKWFYIFSSILIVAGLFPCSCRDSIGALTLPEDLCCAIKWTAPSLPIRSGMPSTSSTWSRRSACKKSGDEFYLRTNELDQEQTAKMTAGLKEKFTNVTLESAESVGATIGSEIARNALIAIGIAIVLMLLYITFRFEFAFGLAAVLSLAQVVLVVVGLFSIFQWEVSSYFVAAILTIIGYSIKRYHRYL